MSKKFNRVFQTWKTVELSVRRRPLTSAGKLLSFPDRCRWAHSLCLWALLAKDMGMDERNVSDRALSSWVGRVADLDCSYVVEQLKEFLDAFRNYNLTMGGVTTRRTFKRYAASFGFTCWLLMEPVSSMVTAYACGYLEDCTKLNTWIQFIIRTTLECEAQEEAGLVEYVQHEQILHSQQYPPEVLEQLRPIALEVASYYEIDSIGRHSNGATAEVRRREGVAEKYRHMQVAVGTAQFARQIGDELLQPTQPHSTCAIQAVPKDVCKKRIISPENTANMFYQHVVFRGMDRMLRRSCLHVDLHDQTPNMRACIRGSVSRSIATIDLSAASDSVTMQLLKGLIGGTRLYADIVRTRSSSAILPDGTQVSLEKVAPMGSKVCFPTECFVFGVICEFVRRSTCSHARYHVYGDDIVVEASLYPKVIELLTACHFTVNTSKTFPPGSEFLESCGMEALRGENISPLRVGRFFDAYSIYETPRTTSPEKVMGAIDLVNGLFCYGFRTARAYELHMLLRKYPNVSFGDEGILSENYTDRGQYRYNKRYQRTERLCDVVHSSVGKGPDDIAYSQTLRDLSQLQRDSLRLPEDRLEVRTGRTHVFLRKSWKA